MDNNELLVKLLQDNLKHAKQATVKEEPLHAEIPPCGEIKDWSKRELILFGLMTGVSTLFVVVYAIWRLGS